MVIKILKLSQDELKKRGVFDWPIWQKEESVFDWFYDSTEQCYILEGEVIVSYEDGKEVSFGAGDFVEFSAGLECTWKINKAVKKHYNFL